MALTRLLSFWLKRQWNHRSRLSIGTVFRAVPTMVCLAIWSAGSVVFAPCVVSAQISANAPTVLTPAAGTTACLQREYRQLDFWIGDWDVSDFDKPSVIDARVEVNSILDGCVVHEDYQDRNGEHGQSFSIYDAAENAWHQTWVTNRGRLLLLHGGLTNQGFVLTGEDRTSEGKNRMVRGTWKPLQAGVRETAVASLDGGKTWQPWFDLLFQPHKD